MSRRAILLQAALLALSSLLGAAILISAVSRNLAGDLRLAGTLQAALLGAGLLLFAVAGLRGVFIRDAQHSPSLLARSYFHSRFGRFTSCAALGCIVGWLALRIGQALWA